MLRYKWVWLLFCCGPAAVYGQNLVPNGGFESFNACPFTFSSIEYSPTYSSFPFVQDWVRPLDLGTPDYFRNCSSPGNASVPKNFAGYQPAHSGLAYAGLIGYYGFDPNPLRNLRELITTRLTEIMIKDSAYCVKFFVSPSHIPSSTTKPVALNEIGAHFSDTMPHSSTAYSLNLPYHILNDTSKHLADTTAWYEVGGVYIASGGEQWMTIGCFNRSVFPATTPPSAGSNYSYDYLDDVSVVQIPLRKTVHVINACDSMKNGSLFLSSSLSAGQYEWSTGEKTRSIRITMPGEYACKAVNDCTLFIDTFHVTGETHDFTHLVKVCDSNNIRTVLSSSAVSNRYAWSTGDTTRVIRINQIGDYYCAAFEGCKIIHDSFHVIAEIPTLPVVRDTIICQYAPSPKLPVDDTTDLIWFTDSAGISGTPVQPLITTGQPRKVVLYVARQGGDCISNKVPVSIIILDKPQARPVEAVVRCEGFVDSGLFFGVPLGAEMQYTWSTGETSCCISPRQDDRYIRVAGNRCGVAADTFILRSEPCERCVEFPTAFTPNGDRLNDGFKALIRCPIERYNLRIYNRWGECVYTSADKDGHWDGTQNGGNAPIGTYMYMASMVQGVTGRTIQVKGAVTLIR